MLRPLPLILGGLIIAACSPRADAPAVSYRVAAMGLSPDLHRDALLSPDGTRMAYSMGIEGLSAIYVADADGSHSVRLTHGVWDTDPHWSPDGQWLAYYSDEGADIWMVPSAGGEPRQLTSGPANDQVLGWLPDGSGVLFTRLGAGELKTLVTPVDGGPVRPLFPEPAGNVIAFPSPDGSKVGFIRLTEGRGTLWVQDLAADAPRQLTTEGFESARVDRMWSPDGRHIVYNSRRTGTLDLWIADVDSGALRQLTTDIRDDYGATWSPDGRWLLFESTRGGQEDQWVIPAAGGTARRVTDDMDFELETATSWSPDGRSVIYGSNNVVSEIAARRPDGGEPRIVLSLPGYGIGSPLDVSPDGGTVLFPSNRSGALDIWSVPVTGGEMTQLAASPAQDNFPAVSPDGRWIAFQSSRRGTWDLWVMPAQGGTPRSLTDWPGAEASPEWSPDGATIAFVSTRDASRTDVWTIPAAGGAATRVTHGNFGVDLVRWSPDGRTLFFVGATPDGSDQLFRVPAGGGTPRLLTQADGGGTINAYFNVSPDGAQVAYVVIRKGYAWIEVVAADGGVPKRISADTARVYQGLPNWSPDGSQVAFVDWDFQTNVSFLAVSPWPNGNPRSLPSATGYQEDFPLWTPDGQELVYRRTKYMTRIVTADVSRLLAADVP